MIKHRVSPEHRSRSRIRWAPVVTLALISPLLLEFLSGDVSLSALPALLGFACLNGAGAVLVREAAIRRSTRSLAVRAASLSVAPMSVAVLLGGALAFALWEEGVLDNSLFDPNAFGPGWLSYGYLRVLGTSPPIVVFELIVDAVFSVLVPIGLTELAFPRHRGQPWLPLPGLAVAGVVFLGGSAATVVITVVRGRWLITVPQLLGVLGVLAVVLVIAFTVRPANPVTWPGRSSPPSWLLGVITLVACSGVLVLVDRRYQLGMQPWLLTVVLLIAAVGMCGILVIPYRLPGRPSAGLFAACAGAVATYAWFGLYRRLAGPPVGVAEQIVLVVGSAVGLVLLGRRSKTDDQDHG